MKDVHYTPSRMESPTSLEDMRNLAEGDFRMTSHQVAKGDLTLHSLGAIQWNGEPHPMTGRAFDQLCQWIKYPISAGAKTPSDFMPEVVKRFVMEPDAADIGKIITNPKGTVVGIVPEEEGLFNPSTHAEVLEEVDRLSTELKMEAGSITDEGMYISFIDPNVKPIRPSESDLARIGLRVINNDSGPRLFGRTNIGAGVLIQYGASIISCTNQIVLAKEDPYFCKVWDPSPWEVRRLEFADSYSRMRKDLPAVQKIASAWGDSNIRKGDFLDTVNMMGRVWVQRSMVEAILQTPMTRIDEWKKEVRDNGKASRKHQLPMKVWYVTQRLTEASKILSVEDRQVVEEHAGALLSSYAA